MRGDFEFPPLKEGHRYRLVVGGLSHVNNGDGFQIYINGKLFTDYKFNDRSGIEMSYAIKDKEYVETSQAKNEYTEQTLEVALLSV